MRALSISLALGVVLLLNSCSQREDQTLGPPPKPEDFPKLEARLFALAIAEKPEAYAQRFGLELKEGRVLVVLELAGPQWQEDLAWAVEALGGRVEASSEDLLQARVPPKVLLTLSQHPRVSYIRPPVRPKI